MYVNLKSQYEYHIIIIPRLTKYLFMKQLVKEVNIPITLLVGLPFLDAGTSLTFDTLFYFLIVKARNCTGP